MKQLYDWVKEFMKAGRQLHHQAVPLGKIPTLEVLNMRYRLIEEELAEYVKAVHHLQNLDRDLDPQDDIRNQATW